MDAPLALLVDEHPLDAYLAAAAIATPRVILVHTADRGPAAQQLLSIMRRRLGVRGNTLLLEDPTSPVSARSTYRDLPEDCHLHHTGGDGSMAANLRAEHAASGRPLDSASCLDEERRILRLDDGVDIRLVDLVDPNAVRLEALLELAGFRILVDDDRERVARAGREVLTAAWPLPWAEVARMTGHGRTAVEFLRAHLDRFRPVAGALAHDGRWKLFRDGLFLELLVERFIGDAAPGNETCCGVRLERFDGMRVEIDVISVGRYRPYLYSCSTTDSLETAKRKAFELIVRARQVGGLTARPTLVTALTEDIVDMVEPIATVDEASPAGAVQVIGIRGLVALGLERSQDARAELLNLDDV